MTKLGYIINNLKPYGLNGYVMYVTANVVEEEKSSSYQNV